MINKLQNTIRTQYDREPATAQANYWGPRTLEKFKIDRKGKLKTRGRPQRFSEPVSLLVAISGKSCFFFVFFFFFLLKKGNLQFQ